MNKIPVLLDVDTGIDDAFALMLAASSPEIDLKAVTTSYGNGTLKQASENTLKAMELLGIEVPVAAGAKKGILSPLRSKGIGASAHGADAFGNIAGLLPYPKKLLEPISAVELMASVISSSDQNVVIVATGPLTNVAIFLLAHPELRSKIDGISISGGAIYNGNILPTVETNIACDPEAAQIVFSSGIKILMCGLDATQKAFATFEDRERFKLANTRISAFLYEALKCYTDYYENIMLFEGCPIHDAVPVAWLINPDLLTCAPYYIEVDLAGRYTRGCTVADVISITGRKPNAVVALDIDRKAYMKMLFEALNKPR